MRNQSIFIVFLLFALNSYSAVKTIHIYVALCDNEFQGIVPVPEKIGNGKDARLNLYWGAGYGVKTYFNLKTQDWKMIAYINLKVSSSINLKVSSSINLKVSS